MYHGALYFLLRPLGSGEAGPHRLATVRGQLCKVGPGGACVALGGAEAVDEGGGGEAEGLLGVDAGVAGDADGGPEEGAERRLVGRVAEGMGGGLEVAAGTRGLGAEAGAFGAADQAVGAEEGGRGGGDGVEGALGPGGVAALGAFVGLDLLPEPLDFRGVVGADLAVDVGVAADELAGDLLDDILDGELALELGDGGLHEDVGEDVAELFADLGRVAVLDRVDELVGLFDEEGGERGGGLLAVPGAAVGAEETLEDPAEAGEGADIVLGRDRGEQPGVGVGGEIGERRFGGVFAAGGASLRGGGIATREERAGGLELGPEDEERALGVEARVGGVEELELVGGELERAHHVRERRGGGRTGVGHGRSILAGVLATRWIATVLFFLSVPLFLVLTNVRVAATEPRVYGYAFSQYNAVERTGVDRAQLDGAARAIVDYFRTGDGDELLDIRVAVDGEEEALYNQREILHMRDVKDLFRLTFRVQEIAFVYLVAYVVAVFLWSRERALRQLANQAILGGALTVALLGAGAIGVLFGFDSLFEQFHLLSFSNDFWRLDPATDRLIQMFPQGFWFDVTLGVGVLTAMQGGLVALAGFGYLTWLERRRGSWRSRGQAALDAFVSGGG